MTDRSKRFGAWGEDAAASYLTENGFRLLERNYRTKYGELDLIAEEGETLVFLEVKARHGLSYGSPKAAVDARKQEHLRQAALLYLQEHTELAERPLRFDVISIVKENGKRAQLEHIRAAF